MFECLFRNNLNNGCVNQEKNIRGSIQSMNTLLASIFPVLVYLSEVNIWEFACIIKWTKKQKQKTNKKNPVLRADGCSGILNKAVLEPRVSPAFVITYFCNHFNIRFENTSKYVDTLTLFSKNLNQRSLTPRWPLTPCLLRSHVWLYPRIIVSKSHDNTSMYVDTVINFAKYHIHTHTTYIHTACVNKSASI